MSDLVFAYPTLSLYSLSVFFSFQELEISRSLQSQTYIHPCEEAADETSLKPGRKHKNSRSQSSGRSRLIFESETGPRIGAAAIELLPRWMREYCEGLENEVYEARFPGIL